MWIGSCDKIKYFLYFAEYIYTMKVLVYGSKAG